MAKKAQSESPKKQIVITAQANDFIYAQPLPVVSAFLDVIHRLEVAGYLAMPDARKIDNELFELRVKVAGNQYRTFYCYAVGNLIYILSGFIKKTPKTPPQEIRKAHRIMKGLGL